MHQKHADNDQDQEKGTKTKPRKKHCNQPQKSTTNRLQKSTTNSSQKEYYDSTR